MNGFGTCFSRFVTRGGLVVRVVLDSRAVGRGVGRADFLVRLPVCFLAVARAVVGGLAFRAALHVGDLGGGLFAGGAGAEFGGHFERFGVLGSDGERVEAGRTSVSLLVY